MTVETRIHRVIENWLEVAPETITPGATLMGDLKADSLTVVEITLALEEEFGLEIPDEDMEKFTTVGDIVTYIQERQS